MKKVESLTGKNLPRLAVAKPGWPGESSTFLDEYDRPFYGKPETTTGRTFYYTDDDGIRHGLRPRDIVCDQTGLKPRIGKDQ